MKVRLTHHCRKPGSEGNAGDVIEVSAADAKYLFDRRGAVPHADEPEVAATRTAKPTSKAARTVETATQKGD